MLRRTQPFGYLLKFMTQLVDMLRSAGKVVSIARGASANRLASHQRG
jgi:hypothetical protein